MIDQEWMAFACWPIIRAVPSDDDERATLVDLCLAHIAGRVPVIVTCSHFSTRIAAAGLQQFAGAAMLMMMPPYHGTDCAPTKPESSRTSRTWRGRGILIMVQDNSVVSLSVAFLVRLAREIPAVSYFKIEVPGAAAKLRGLIEAGGDAIAGPFDGEESITLMADLDAGATGTMPSALLPDLIEPVLEFHRAGKRKAAAAAYARLLPLINFENRQCGLRATKT
jgi:dihydrodipicolinate synthase/N-acetylneuraminate lyase